jgi:hypothetical protein
MEARDELTKVNLNISQGVKSHLNKVTSTLAKVGADAK